MTCSSVLSPCIRLYGPREPRRVPSAILNRIWIKTNGCLPPRRNRDTKYHAPRVVSDFRRRWSLGMIFIRTYWEEYEEEWIILREE